MVKETALEKWQMEIMYMNGIGMMTNLWEIKIEVKNVFDYFFIIKNKILLFRVYIWFIHIIMTIYKKILI